MQLPKNESPLCAHCQKKPAVKRYTRKTFSQMVCATCFDRWSVQEVLEDEMLHILDLEHAKKYDEALACLDAILEANRDRDHDGWLANSVALSRSSILFDAGRYAEAEQAYSEWAQIGFIDLWRRQMHALGLAKTLEALGRDREAVAVLENVLGHEEPKDLPLALTVLIELVRISDKLDLPVDSKWLRIAEAAAGCYGVDLPARDSPGEAIVALGEVTRGRQPKRPSE